MAEAGEKNGLKVKWKGAGFVLLLMKGDAGQESEIRERIEGTIKILT